MRWCNVRNVIITDKVELCLGVQGIKYVNIYESMNKSL